MRWHIFWLVMGLAVVESLRLFIPFDRLANEVQLVSATPWMYAGIRLLHHLHKRGK